MLSNISNAKDKSLEHIKSLLLVALIGLFSLVFKEGSDVFPDIFVGVHCFLLLLGINRSREFV